jgi:hypothetical protein
MDRKENNVPNNSYIIHRPVFCLKRDDCETESSFRNVVL